MPRGATTGRRGLYTSGVVALRDGHRVRAVLQRPPACGARTWRRSFAHRAEELPPPIQMCDALSPQLAGRASDDPGALPGPRPAAVLSTSTIASPRCAAHLLESLAVVYHNDAVARERQLSAEARLRFHQETSGADDAGAARLAGSGNWARSVPNPIRALGGAIGYTLKHWEKLYAVPAPRPVRPLDNNVCERALKKAILHRKKRACSTRPVHGAQVGGPVS